MLAAPTAIVVVVTAVAAADLGGWWVEAVARHPFSIDDAIAPCVVTGRGASMCARWVLHQVKVHQYLKVRPQRPRAGGPLWNSAFLHDKVSQVTFGMSDGQRQSALVSSLSRDACST